MGPANVAIQRCYEKAKMEGNEYFALEDNVECFTSSNAGQTYNKYGAAGGCRNGRGGGWRLTVYKLPAAELAYTQVGCYKDRRSRAISGGYVNYPANVAIQRCYEKAKMEGNEY